MTKEDKVKKRIERKNKRVAKKNSELREIFNLMNNSSSTWDSISFYQARAKVRGNYSGRGFICEMRYGDCEARGFCNGDC